MADIWRKDYLIFLLIFCLQTLLLAFAIRTIYPIHYLNQPIFSSELINSSTSIPPLLIFILGAGSLALIWLISKKIFPSYQALIPPLIYSLSPWSIYLSAANSFYIYFLFLILLIGYALLIKDDRARTTLLVIGITVSFYSSILALIIIPLLVLSAICLKQVSLKEIKITLYLTAVLSIPLLLLLLLNFAGFKNIARSQISLLSDPEYINSSNSFYGESQKMRLDLLAKLSENKYEYIGKYLINKSIKNIAPSTYFTPQEKLLGFSFTPPIYLGFLFPFLLGVNLILVSPIKKYLIFSLILLIPSFLSKQSLDLNRLIIFAPILIFTISYGLIALYNHRSKALFKTVFYLTLFLVVLQFALTVFDMNTREYPRFDRYFGINLEVGKQ